MSGAAGHVVLLGDSIFDNGAYVGGGPDVAAQLREQLGDAWRVTLAAVDGAVIDDVHRQLARIPDDATHLVLSAGGNDALRYTGLLDQRLSHAAQLLDAVADATDAFAARYRRLLSAMLRHALPTTVCTIYGGNLGAEMGRRAAVLLAAFDDRILRAALATGVQAIELRDVCDDPADYANPIEPSVRGGSKIAAAIAAAIGQQDGSATRSLTFGRQ